MALTPLPSFEPVPSGLKHLKHTQQVEDALSTLHGEVPTEIDNATKAAANVFYVSPTGDDTNTGRSWAEAFATVGAGLSALGTAKGIVYVAPGTHTLAAGLAPASGQFIEGAGSSATVLEFNATGWAATLAANSGGLRKLKIVLGATPAGGLLHKDGAYFCRSSEIEVEAPVRTAGQVGIRWEQNVTGGPGCYWNRVVESKVNNLSISLQTESTGGGGANVNTFTGNLYQADVCLDINARTTGFLFDGSMDTFQNGIGVQMVGESIRNTIRARAEGGPGSQAYYLGPGTYENFIEMDTNCPVQSVDDSTEKTNLVTHYSNGSRKPWPKPTDFVPLGNPFSDATVAQALNGASGIIGFAPFQASQLTEVERLNILVDTQSGNIDVGIYTRSGTTMTRVVSTGSVLCPAAGPKQLTLPVTRLYPGRYYIALTADNATAKFRVAGLNGVGSFMEARLATTGTNFPLPASVGSAAWDKLLTATVQRPT